MFVVVFLRVSPLVCGGIHASNFRHIPSSVPLAPDGRDVALDEPIFAVVSDEGVDLVTRFHLPEGLCVFHHRRLTTSHCSFLAGISEVIIARDIIPLPILMPDYNNTVFSSRKEAVWLVWSPVLILQWATISPAEVTLKHLVIEANPLVVVANTVDEDLLLVGQDAGQVRSLQAALPLRRVPRAPVREVLVALPLELVPAVVTRLRVLFTESPNVAGQAQAGEGVEAVYARGSVPTRVGLALIDI